GRGPRPRPTAVRIPRARPRRQSSGSCKAVVPIPTTELEHHFADLEECRLHYVSRGEGKPILFLHGFPQFWFLWRNQLADLGDDHAVFAPDMRGYNLSCKPEDPEAYRMRH